MIWVSIGFSAANQRKGHFAEHLADLRNASGKTPVLKSYRNCLERFHFRKEALRRTVENSDKDIL